MLSHVKAPETQVKSKRTAPTVTCIFLPTLPLQFYSVFSACFFNQTSWMSCCRGRTECSTSGPWGSAGWTNASSMSCLNAALNRCVYRIFVLCCRLLDGDGSWMILRWRWWWRLASLRTAAFNMWQTTCGVMSFYYLTSSCHLLFTHHTQLMNSMHYFPPVFSLIKELNQHHLGPY